LVQPPLWPIPLPYNLHHPSHLPSPHRPTR
jgi:hypothetical protein